MATPMFAILLAAIASANAAGVGGFIKINFPYNSDKASLLSKLTVVVKTPQGSLVDQTEVQPTGYWIIPTTPTYRELIVSVRGPSGIIISPLSKTLTVPFNGEVYFHILGFSVTGNIVTKNSNSQNVPVSAALNVEVTGKNISLTTTSDTDGSYSLGPLVPGEYTVSIKDAIAEPQTIKIVDSSVACPELLITDWPQSGHINFPEGVTPRSISLELSGDATRTFATDKDGFFMLKDLNVGRYHLRCTEEGVSVSELSFQVTSSALAQQLILNFEGVTLSGSVKFPDGTPLAGAVVRLFPSNAVAKSDNEGCFEFTRVLPAAEPSLEVSLAFYTFSVPKLSPITTQKPSFAAVTVVNARIDVFVDCDSADISVSEPIPAAFTLTNKSFSLSAPAGTAVLISAASKCGFEKNEIAVKAPSPLVKFQRIKATVKGSVKCLGDCPASKSVILKNSQYTYEVQFEGDRFEVEDVEFGAYSLAISPPSSAEFRVDAATANVDRKEVDLGVVGSQTAFVFPVTASHEMTVMCGGQLLELKRGLNTVRALGAILTPGDCHIFAPVDLREQNRVVVESIEREIKVLSESPLSKFEVFVNGKRLNAPYKFTQGLDEEITAEVVAVAPYYVEPHRQTVRAPSGCADRSISFEVIRGIEFRGQVFPAIEGINVTASVDGRVIASAVTSTAGEYTLGSHPSNLKVVLSATKPGYNVRLRQGSFDFDVEKLAHVAVTITGAQTEGVLLSLSREDGFAENHFSEGTLTHIYSLAPGKYFLKPILREHEFEPSMSQFELKSGADFAVAFDAVRTRFGISGEVRRITGEAEPDIEIAAVLPTGEQVIETTDERGRFRIGMLPPNATYTLIARASGTSKVSTVTPETLRVRLENEERTGVRFLSLKAQQTVDLLGEVDVPGEFLEALNVILMSGQTVVDRFTFPSRSSNLFYFTNLTMLPYTVKVATTRQLSAELNCPPIDVEGSGSHQSVKIQCSVVHRADEASSASKWVAPAISAASVLVWIVFFNFKTIRDILSDLIPSRK